MRLCYLVLVGCASTTTPAAPQKATPRHPVANHDRDQIEKAYAARDTHALLELLDIVTDRANVALAREYYVKLELEALVKLDCNAFIAAFQPVKNRANPRTEFGALTADFDPNKKSYIIETVVGIAARCRSPQLFSPSIRRAVPDASVDEWSAALVSLDRKGLPVFDAFLGALRSSAKGIDPLLASKWLVAARSTSDCHDLEAAAGRAEPAMRASLVDFYVQKGCRNEADRSCHGVAAKELAAHCAPRVTSE